MTGRDAWDAWYAWLSQLEHYADGVELAMPRTAQGLRDVIAAMPDLQSHDAEVAAAALREAASQYPWGNGMTFTDWLRARADEIARADEGNPR